MIQKKILIFAYSDVGYSCTKYLIENGEKIIGIYTHEDNPHEKIWFPSVLKLAQEKNIPVFTPEDLKDASHVDHIKKLNPDLIFSFYYRYMIPPDILSIPPLGAFNMHGSLLPKYRGRAPVNWAVLHGEKESGATLHMMVEKPDAGLIVDREAVPIHENDTTSIVQARVTEAAVRILARQIEALKEGTAPRINQNLSEGSYFGRRKPEDGKIDWSKSSQEIHNLIRAVTHPYPGAFTDKWGKITYIWSSRLAPDRVSYEPPGSIIIDEFRYYVVCGDEHCLEILSAQKEGGEIAEGLGLKKILHR